MAHKINLTPNIFSLPKAEILHLKNWGGLINIPLSCPRDKVQNISEFINNTRNQGKKTIEKKSS